MKNDGNEYPISATPMIDRSCLLPRRSADSTPMETPPAIQMMNAPSASCPVTGNRLTIRSVTCSPLRKE